MVESYLNINQADSIDSALSSNNITKLKNLMRILIEDGRTKDAEDDQCFLCFKEYSQNVEIN